MEETITLRTPAKYAALADEFTRSYDLMQVVITAASNKKGLLHYKKRTCRFCEKSVPQTTFNNEAHLVPHFLGNNSLYSDFECDSCNAIFSQYENHLANLLGAERTLNKVKGKMGIPKFKSPGGLKITNEAFYNKDSLQISRESVNDSTFTFDEEKSQMTITFPKNSYIPLAAYKSLLKIALSILPKEEIEQYGRLKKYLTQNDFGNLSGCSVVKYYLPFGMDIPPHLFLFKKKDESEEAFTHIMYMACLNYIFWVPVMLHDHDLAFYNKTVNYKIPPPLFAMAGDLESINISRSLEDWSFPEMRKGEKQELSFNMNKGDLKKIATFNPATGQIGKEVQFDVSKIVSLVLAVDDGQPIEFKAFGNSKKIDPDVYP